MSVYGATKISTASIYLGISSDTGDPITAEGNNGILEVSSSGPVYYVQGYDKKQITLWPDAIVASLIGISEEKKEKRILQPKRTPNITLERIRKQMQHPFTAKLK